MSFERPTLTQLVDRVQSDFLSRLDLSSPVLRRSVVFVLSRVVAGAAHMLHGHLDFLARQLFPDQSEDEFLERQAGVYGLSRNPADFAKVELEATGVDASIIPAGALYRSAAGLEYSVDEDATIASGTATVSITAVLAGADSSLTDGVELSLESPISGVDTAATVDAVTQDGVDQETIESLRTRLKEHLAEPAHGGTIADYIAWAKEVPGVTRVWVSPLELGPGTVVVRFVRDDDPDPIPDAGEVTAVQTKLDTEAPAHATVTAFAPTDSPVNITLHVEPNTAAVRDAVRAELEDLFVRVPEPGGTTLLSSIQTAVGSSPGVVDYAIALPAADVTHTTNQLPSLGTVIFT